MLHASGRIHRNLLAPPGRVRAFAKPLAPKVAEAAKACSPWSDVPPRCNFGPLGGNAGTCSDLAGNQSRAAWRTQPAWRLRLNSRWPTKPENRQRHARTGRANISTKPRLPPPIDGPSPGRKTPAKPDAAILPGAFYTSFSSQVTQGTCAKSPVVSNIRLFPMATLPCWPFRAQAASALD